MTGRLRPGTRVAVRVPASSANLGPGFDALALALAIYDDVEVVVTARGAVVVDVTGEGAADLPGDDTHLVAASLLRCLARLGVSAPGVHIGCRNGIPQSRGLGSSAAAIVAGVVAGRLLTGRDDTRAGGQADALALATAIEGHPDNVAATLLGGATIAWYDGNHPAAKRFAKAQGLRPWIFIAPGRGATAADRAALPDLIAHADAAVNAGRAALLVHALGAAPDLLMPATEDRLHQRYRSHAVPATAALVATLRAAGVPAAVSGAGPSVIAFGRSGADLAHYAPPGWLGRQIDIDAQGARPRPAEPDGPPAGEAGRPTSGDARE
ncbi:MAG: homoserine kinase [Mycobacteriales bacterium]